MEKFINLKGIAAPLKISNVDTDMIIPKQYLKTIKRTGLAKGLFAEMRFDTNGAQVPDFVLNKAPFDRAKILVAGENFGCGSSREHAPWALLDFGIKCVIAPSFADIFYNNCFKNGILPIVLSGQEVQQLWDMIGTNSELQLEIDLPAQCIVFGRDQSFSFDIDPFRKKCLLEGLDDIGLTLEYEGLITSFEKGLAVSRPWV